MSDDGAKKQVEASTTPDSDKDLDALLNSALEDFDKPPPATKATVTELPSESAVANSSGTPDAEEVADPKWTEEFIKQAAAQFEQNMQSLLSQVGPEGQGANAMEGLGGLRPEELGQNFQRIAEAAARAIGEETSEGDFTAAISQTLKNLSEGAENLQNPLSDDDLMSMFGGLGMGEPGEGGDFLPFMQNMMQSLLSKEILYPALKDIVDKYPDWLSDNGGSLDPTELERYTKQKDLMTQVCLELEQETTTDPADVKTARFNKILDLMQKMQECGHPPPDLVGDLGSVINFDGTGGPALPGMNLPPGVDPANCCVMKCMGKIFLDLMWDTAIDFVFP